MIPLNTERNKRLIDLLLTYGAIPFWGIVLFYTYSQLMPRAKYGILFLGSILLIYIVDEMTEVFEEEDLVSLVLLLASAAVIIPVTGYMYSNFNLLYVAQAGRAEGFQLWGALAFVLVMVYLTYRAFGFTFLIVLLAGIAYGLFGDMIPGILGHGGITYNRMLRTLVIEVDGFFGFLNQLTAAWIAPFLLYAGLLKSYGAFQLILRLAVRSAKYLSSGVAQTAVIASAIIGSVNGSQTANAGMTGSFTIPMMKENGVKPETAGAIEAVASTSGQVLPPVMGAAAFIMPSLVEDPTITYFTVIMAGLIPATVLVVSIVIAVHYVAAPQIDDPEMEGHFEDKLPPLQMAIDLGKFAVPLALLVWLLGPAGYTIMTGALVTATSMIFLGITVPIAQQVYRREAYTAAFWRETAGSLKAFFGPSDGATAGDADSGPGHLRGRFQTAKEATSPRVGQFFGEIRLVFRQTRDGFKEGAVVLAPIAIILAAINGVVDILLVTATPTAVSLALMDMSGGILIIAGLLAMIICILLGLGMPTTAAYTIVAILVAPTLATDFMLPELSAHYFVFYAAILAGLTPPIATTVAVTCGIAGSGFWSTAAESIKISSPLFILPFAFLYHPELVGAEFHSGALLSGVLALAGSIAIIHGLAYHFTFDRALTLAARGVFFVLGVVIMIHPNRMIQLGAFAVAIALYVAQASIGRPSPFAAVRGIGAGLNGRFRS